MIPIKTDEQISIMREGGLIMKSLFNYIEGEIKAGMTTKQLDGLIFEYIKQNGADAPCLNYEGYPAATCISVDNMVVHGIPSDGVIIKDGQIVSVDVVIGYKGFMTDATRTYMIGKVDDLKQKLVKVTEECFFEAVNNIRDGSPIGDIGYYVQTHAESNGFSVVRALTGHGIGHDMHESPVIPNYGKKGTGLRLKKGMVIAIEPMINAGGYDVDFLSDGWGVVTRDGKPSAHYENTVAITESGVEILTL